MANPIQSYLEYTRTQDQILEEERKRKQEKAEAEARAHTFSLEKMAIPAITSLLTMNPAPLALAAAGEGTRAATGSDLDLATAAQGLEKFLPSASAATLTKPGIPKPPLSSEGAIGPRMESGNYFSPQAKALNVPKPVDKSFLERLNPLDTSNWTKPMTTDEQENMKSIARGDVKLKSFTQGGRTYEKPEVNYKGSELELAKEKLRLENSPEQKRKLLAEIRKLEAEARKADRWKSGDDTDKTKYNATQADKRSDALMQDPDAQAITDGTIFIDNATGFTYKKSGNEFISMGY